MYEYCDVPWHAVLRIHKCCVVAPMHVCCGAHACVLWRACMYVVARVHVCRNVLCCVCMNVLARMHVCRDVCMLCISCVPLRVRAPLKALCPSPFPPPCPGRFNCIKIPYRRALQKVCSSVWGGSLGIGEVVGGLGRSPFCVILRLRGDRQRYLTNFASSGHYDTSA